jgi:hypothetical protein
MAEGLIDGAAFAVDGSLIAADANKQRSAAGSDEVDWQALARTRRSVEATRAIRQAEVGAARTMIERTEERLGSAEMLGWLVNERAIEPHIPVFDKSARTNAIRRFDPSRPSQPLAQPERVDSLWQKALQFLGFSCGCLESPVSRIRQPWREFVESLRPGPQKFPFSWRRLAEKGSIATER